MNSISEKKNGTFSLYDTRDPLVDQIWCNSIFSDFMESSRNDFFIPNKLYQIDD